MTLLNGAGFKAGTGSRTPPFLTCRGVAISKWFSWNTGVETDVDEQARPSECLEEERAGTAHGLLSSGPRVLCQCPEALSKGPGSYHCSQHHLGACLTFSKELTP